jgi:hypothetical protein
MTVEITVAKKIRRKIPRRILEHVAYALSEYRRVWHIYIKEVQAPIAPDKKAFGKFSHGYDAWDLWGSFDDEDGYNFDFSISGVTETAWIFRAGAVFIDPIEERENPS